MSTDQDRTPFWKYPESWIQRLLSIESFGGNSANVKCISLIRGFRHSDHVTGAVLLALFYRLIPFAIVFAEATEAHGCGFKGFMV